MHQISETSRVSSVLVTPNFFFLWKSFSEISFAVSHVTLYFLRNKLFSLCVLWARKEGFLKEKRKMRVDDKYIYS